MHLTNYAINKENPNFIFNESVESKSLAMQIWTWATNDH